MKCISKQRSTGVNINTHFIHTVANNNNDTMSVKLLDSGKEGAGAEGERGKW